MCQVLGFGRSQGPSKRGGWGGKKHGGATPSPKAFDKRDIKRVKRAGSPSQDATERRQRASYARWWANNKPASHGGVFHANLWSGCEQHAVCLKCRHNASKDVPGHCGVIHARKPTVVKLCSAYPQKKTAKTWTSTNQRKTSNPLKSCWNERGTCFTNSIWLVCTLKAGLWKQVLQLNMQDSVGNPYIRYTSGSRASRGAEVSKLKRL